MKTEFVAIALCHVPHCIPYEMRRRGETRSKAIRALRRAIMESGGYDPEKFEVRKVRMA